MGDVGNEGNAKSKVEIPTWIAGNVNKNTCYFCENPYAHRLAMDGLIIICALVGITAECSRRMWRAFGRGDVETAAPRPYSPSRMSLWLAHVDWERCLGLRYEFVALPASAAPSRKPESSSLLGSAPVSPAPIVEDHSESVEAEPSDIELADRLEAALVQSGVQAFLDDLGLDLPAAEPPEGLIRLDDVIIVGQFVSIDPMAGQPVGDPSVLEETVISRKTATPSRSETVTIAIPVADLVSQESHRPTGVLGGEPVGDPGVFDEMPARRVLPVAIVESVPAVVAVSFAPVFTPIVRSLVSPGEPVGDPGVVDGVVDQPPVSSDAAQMLRFPDGGVSEDYRIAASLRKAPEEYAVAAYTLNSGDDKDAVRNDDSGENEELAPDPLAEIISEILEEEEPGEDPNTLELPLVQVEATPTVHPPRAGEPVGDPGVFDVGLPLPIKAQESAAESEVEPGDDDEPSAPIAREVNRISERVESILSSALARPAPAVNFSDALEKMAERSRVRKQAKEEASNRLPSQAVDDNIARSADRDGGLKMTEYKVQFEIFEGPLDLLLYLVKKQEVDIYEVNLTQIAEEFIKYIELMRSFDLEVAGEFLVMAASLMYIKSKELLPVEQQSQLDEDAEEDDPRWELIRQLVEYKKFKDAAAEFKRLELAQEDVFPNNPPKPDFPVQRLKANVSVFDLLGAVNRVLERIDSKETREIFADRWTVSEKIEQIRNEILAKGRVKFFDLFEDALSRTEVVATFLALLELIKLKVIVVDQSAVFSDIDICKAPAGHRLNLDESEEDDLPLEGEAMPVSEFDAPTGAEE